VRNSGSRLEVGFLPLSLHMTIMTIMTFREGLEDGSRSMDRRRGQGKI
jgi:hypothetical protein